MSQHFDNVVRRSLKFGVQLDRAFRRKSVERCPHNRQIFVVLDLKRCELNASLVVKRWRAVLELDNLSILGIAQKRVERRYQLRKRRVAREAKLERHRVAGFKVDEC